LLGELARDREVVERAQRVQDVAHAAAGKVLGDHLVDHRLDLAAGDPVERLVAEFAGDAAA
jgi:hypothetical protein